MSVRLVSQERLPPPLEGYVLLERLGRGGFGEVWKAEAPGGLLKAIKFVFGDLEDQDDEHTRAAEQEKKALERVKKIRHPYILSLERYDIIDGQLIIVMELADRNLWDRFRECRNLGMTGIPRAELLSYLAEAAEALDLMNNQFHIQHLDIKPQNLFLVHNHVKVADFGLAKTFEGVRGTVTGGVTPVYAGPETFEGYVSRYTDQYSLAIVFQELLTGTRPFNGANTKQLLMQHLTGEPDLSALSAEDQRIIGRGLAKKPDERWPSCSELIAQLRQVTENPGGRGIPTATVVESELVTRMRNTSPEVNTPRPDPLKLTQKTVPGMPTGTVHPEAPFTVARAKPSPLPMPFVPGSGTISTPLPRLITPRMVSSGSSGTVQMPTTPPSRTNVTETARLGSLGLAAPERAEDGVLIPALVISIGRSGFLAHQKFRAALRERFASLDAVTHIRHLYIDTDPEAVTLASMSSDPIPSREMILSRLHRAHHYVQKQSLGNVEQWMPQGQLYSIARNPGAAGGVRSYGRLALVDNYKTIVQRVRQELEPLLKDDLLDRAASTTGLGVRSNRVRVYLIAGLGGGTGSGMVLDLAYILRKELIQIGYSQPETIGLLLAPPCDNSSSRTAIANTYAALKELEYFQLPGTCYQGAFDKSEPAFKDVRPPFSRCVLIQLPRRAEPRYQARTAGLVARSIYLDLFTSAGRTLDEVRNEANNLNSEGQQVVQTFGMYRLTWPRPEMLTVATRRFALRLLQRWTSKDSSHLHDPIHSWLDEQWTVRNLDLDAVVARFDASVREALREDSDKVFDAMVNMLRAKSANSNTRVEAEDAAVTLEQILDVVGRPDQEQGEPGSLCKVLSARYQKMAAEAEKHLGALSVWFLEQPQYRLAGSEEVLAQLSAKMKRTIEGLEGVRATLSTEVTTSYERIFALLGGLGSGVVRRGAVSTELTEHLRTYPRKRLKLMVLDNTLSLYRTILCWLPEYHRELEMCRARLSEISQSITLALPTAEGAGPGRMILPHGVEGLDGAADLFLGALPPDQIVAFDQHLQGEIQKQFKALVNVCTRPEISESFTKMLLQHAREFLDARLENADPATVFFRFRADGANGQKMITGAFESAAPDIGSAMGRLPMEASVLACPNSAEGARFREVVQSMLPGVEFIPATIADDIVFFREYPLFPMAELPQLSRLARQEYDAVAQGGQSPHCRSDIRWLDSQ